MESTIIADQLMKLTGHVVISGANQGLLEESISDAQFSSS